MVKNSLGIDIEERSNPTGTNTDRAHSRCRSSRAPLITRHETDRKLDAKKEKREKEVLNGLLLADSRGLSLVNDDVV
jgi:hypothetical protein